MKQNLNQLFKNQTDKNVLKELNILIEEGFLKIINYTEVSYFDYRKTIASLMSKFHKSKNNINLSDSYYILSSEVINIDKKLAHLPGNASDLDIQEYRISQLKTIVFLLQNIRSDILSQKQLRQSKWQTWWMFGAFLVSTITLLFSNLKCE